MERLLIVENDAGDGPGHLLPAAIAAELDVTVVRVHAGEAVPSVDDADRFVILGGAMGVYEADAHPWIEDEAHLVRDAVAADIPVLGICLGAQIIAHALGGSVYRADTPEVGVVRSVLTKAGSRDPLADHLTRPFLAFHQDTFELPPGSELLAESDRFPQVLRAGSALAIQSHPEVSVDVAAMWGERSPLPSRAGVDYDTVLDEMRESVRPEDAIGLFSAWLGFSKVS